MMKMQGIMTISASLELLRLLATELGDISPPYASCRHLIGDMYEA